jgi:GMP synthase (glutamine-hydrolysing)
LRFSKVETRNKQQHPEEGCCFVTGDQMKLLLIQYRTDASKEHEQACVLRYTGLNDSEVVIANPLMDPGVLKRVNLAEFDAMAIGGSGEFQIPTMPSDVANSLETIRPLIDQAIEMKLPVIGMCFGHQILAWHFGILVVTDPQQSQVGSYPVTLTEEGRADPLFADLPTEFIAQHGHKDTIMGLPEGAVHLAMGKKHAYNAFRIGSAYGVQFHPELGLEDLVTRLTIYPDYLKGKSLDDVRLQFTESPEAPKILANFLAIVRQRSEQKVTA